MAERGSLTHSPSTPFHTSAPHNAIHSNPTGSLLKWSRRCLASHVSLSLYASLLFHSPLTEGADYTYSTTTPDTVRVPHHAKLSWRVNTATKEEVMSTILLVLLVLLVVGALPTWPYSSGWGYGPSGGLGLVLVVLLILVLTGRL